MLGNFNCFLLLFLPIFINAGNYKRYGFNGKSQNCNEIEECTENEYGFLKPYPPNCHFYFYCDFDGSSLLSSCPQNYNFDIYTNDCLPIDEATCQNCDSSTTISPELCSHTPTCDISEAGLTKPYPPDCTKYIYCNGEGNVKIRSCTTGNHYSSTDNRCVLPELANCNYCVTEAPTTTVVMCDEIPTCCAEEWGFVKPYPPDCQKYIYCDQGGIAKISSCPYGEHFSLLLEECTNPEDAGCVSCFTTITTPTQEATTTTEITIAPTTSEEDTTTDTLICPEIVECAPEDVGLTKPYPPDCQKYIYCTLTSFSIRRCVFGYEYSPSLLRCVPKAESNCLYCIITTLAPTTRSTTDEPSTTTNEPSTTTEESSTTTDLPPATTYEPSTTTILTTTMEETTTDTLICPEIVECAPEDAGLTKPYPPDCQKYIYCTLTSFSIRKCVFGYEYSPSLLRCVPKAESDCLYCIITTIAPTTISTTDEPLTTTDEPSTTTDEPSTTTEEPSTTTDLPSTTTDEPSTTTILTTTLEETTTDTLICPEIVECAPEDVGLTKPYPSDCQKYIYCTETSYTIRKCMIGYEYSPSISSCVPKDQSDCPYCIITTTTQLPTTLSTEQTTTEINICPAVPSCSLEEAGLLKAYPPDCSKYIYCNVFGEAVLSLCQFERHFSEEVGLCVSPEDSNCQNCGGTDYTTDVTIAVCDEIQKCSQEGEVLPFPPDCSKYIYCDGSEWGVLSLCGLNQHFSPTALRCLSILEANCPVCEEIIIPTTITTITTTEVATITFTPETTIAVCRDVQKCSQEGETLPYPADCTMYIYCDSSEWGVLSKCGIDKHFSPTLLRCLSISEANCPYCEEIVASSTSEPITTTMAITSTGLTTAEPTSPEPTSTESTTITEPTTTTTEPTTTTTEPTTTTTEPTTTTTEPTTTTTEPTTTTTEPTTTTTEPTTTTTEPTTTTTEPTTTTTEPTTTTTEPTTTTTEPTTTTTEPTTTTTEPTTTTTEPTTTTTEPTTTTTEPTTTTIESTTTKPTTTTTEPTTTTIPPMRQCDRFDTPSCKFLTFDTRRAYPPNCNLYLRCTILYTDVWFTCPKGEIFNQKNEKCERVATNGACEPCEPGPEYTTVPPTSETEAPWFY